MHRGVEIGVFTDHQRVVPAHFQREDFLGLCGELPVQMLSGLRTAGKEQAVNTGMSGQRHTGIASALQQIEHARRQSCLLPKFDRCFGAGRGKFARLEYHAIAGDECRHDMAVW